jgi:hypothetical protein
MSIVSFINKFITMNHPKIQEISDWFDELLLWSKNEISEKSQQIFKALGIEWFAKIFVRSKKYWLSASQKILQDLVKVSFLVYANTDKLPIQRRVILPSISWSYKFIVASLPYHFVRWKSDTIFENEDTNVLFLISTWDDMHAKIAEKMWLKSQYYWEISILWWAWIDIDHENKIFNIRGDSGSYGSCSNQIVERMLEEYKNKSYYITIDMKDQREFLTSTGEISKEVLLEKKLELLHKLLIPSDISIILEKELSSYQKAFDDFQKSTSWIRDPFDQIYISALRKFRDILLQDI